MRAWELHQEGWPHVRIAEAFGVTEAAVSQWVKAATDGGVKALRSKSREGQGARLSDDQVQHLLALLELGPERFGFVGALWTCMRIAQVIERAFGVSYHPAHVSRLLRQQNWTYQKPILRASQRDEALVAEWLTRGWPEIKKKAQKEARTIVFVDEAGFFLTPTATKTWSLARHTPVLLAPCAHEHLSVIGGLTLEGSLYIQVHTSSMGAQGAVQFLCHLLHHIPERLLVLWDRAKIHKNHELEQFRRLDTIGRMVIEFFPSYAPEVDPQEYVWHQLKHVDLRNLSSYSLDQLWVRLRNATQRLRQRVGLLKNLIRHAGLET